MHLEIMESLVQDALKTLNRTVATLDANSHREIQMFAESLKKMDLENLKFFGGLKFRAAQNVCSCLDLHVLGVIPS